MRLNLSKSVMAMAVACSMLLGVAQPAFAVADEEPPVLKSISIGSSGNTVGVSGPIVTKEKPLQITVEATDEISGIKSVEVYADGFGSASLTQTGDTYTGELRPWDSTAPGKYSIREVRLTDIANYVSKYTHGDAEYDLDQFGSLSFEYANDDFNPPGETNDGDMPEVTDIRIVGETAVDAGSEVTIEATATDPTSPVAYVYVALNDKSSGRSYSAWLYPSPDNKDLFTATIKISEFAPDGTYVLSEMHVRDSSGSTRSYSGDDITWDVSFTVTNTSGKTDVTAPTLEQVQYMATPNGAQLTSLEVEAPAMVYPVIKAADDISGLAMVRMIYKNVKNTKYDRRYESAGNVSKDNTAVGTLDISQYEPTGNFVLYELQLWDAAGNTRQYSFGGSNGEAMPFETAFYVQNIASYDKAININDVDVDDIKNLPDNGTIAITYNGNESAPADLFEAIRGTNKTIVFSGNGIQWEFNGMDISGSPKAIQLGVNIEKVSNSSSPDKEDIAGILGNTPNVVLHFADNGQLPGKCKINVKANYLFNDMGDEGLSVYHYDRTNDKLSEIATDLNINEQSQVSFDITHNSDYVITKGKLSNTQGNANRPADNNNAGGTPTVTAPAVVTGGGSGSSGGDSKSNVTGSSGTPLIRRAKRGGVTKAGANIGLAAATPAGTVTASAVESWFKSAESVTLYVTQALEVERGVLEFLKAHPTYTLILRQQEKGAVVVQATLSGKTLKVIPETNMVDLSMTENPVETMQLVQKFYSNDAMAISFSQAGALNLPVNIAVRGKSSLKAADLMVYLYDRKNNTVSLLQGIQPVWDENGYVHFDATLGGEYILTNKALASKS